MSNKKLLLAAVGGVISLAIAAGESAIACDTGYAEVLYAGDQGCWRAMGYVPGGTSKVDEEKIARSCGPRTVTECVPAPEPFPFLFNPENNHW